MIKGLVSAAALTLLMAGPVMAASDAPGGPGVASEQIKNDFVAAWNAHDAKKMAGVFAPDADLINPFNRVESGRGAIEKLFAEEQGGPMKASTYKVESSSVREISRDSAIVDWTSVVTGIMGPDGKPVPEFHHHVTLVLVKRGRWMLESARAYIFAPPPPK